MEVEKSAEELDKGDHMPLENFNIWAEFFSKYGTLPAAQENEVMDLFKYFIGRDMLLLAERVNNPVEDTQLESDGEIENVDISKVYHLIMQKSKDFYLIQKKKGNAVNVAGLIFTEEDSISGWVNRQEKDLKIKMPDTFDKLESFNNGHNFECFHHLDVDVINEEIKALHHGAFLFFERKEVKDKLHKLLLDFALLKETSHLKIGKLTTVSKQTNANYTIPEKSDSNAEHGFVENFCELFKLREKLKNLRREVEEKEYTLSYPSMMGNVVFNSSLFWKCSFFEELFKPVVENLNESDRIRGSKFMIMSLKAQINGLKFVMNRDYLILINIRLYKEVISKFISLQFLSL